MKLFHTFVAFAAGSALLLAGCAGSSRQLKNGKSSEGEVVEAEGMTPYNADDLPGTKAAALAAAQRSAVELVVGVYVNAKTRVDKAVAIQNQILTNTSGYVKRYEILSEGRDGQWYKMRIRALVATGDLRNDLDSLGLLKQPAVGYPRVTIMLQEYVGENPDATLPASRSLTDVLLKQGFKVVQLPTSVDPQEDAVQVAKGLSRNTAELLIAGLARAQSMEMDSRLGGMSSFRASVSARVIETGSGEVVATISETASGLEATREIAADKALSAAAELAGKDLATLPTELSKRAHVDVTVTGLTAFGALSSFQKSLSSLPGVKDQFLRSYSQSDGVAVLDVLVDQISPQELADQCAKIGGPAWTVVQLSGRSVQLSSSPAGR